MSQISDSITNLSLGEKRALLERLLRRKARELKPFALSFAQERMWFLNQLDPGSPFYNIPIAVRLTGKLNVAALERALSEIIDRHEVLRTAFPTIDGLPVQIIYPAKPVTLLVENLSNLPECEREKRAERLVNEEARSPFDLIQGPLLRLRLLRLSDDEHVALFTMHHIISDGWSMGVLVREAATLYESFSKGERSPLPELPIQYADYAVWQREWLQGEVLEEQLGYWKRQLANTPPLLELPADRPRPAVQSFVGATESLELPASLCVSLKAISLREGATLFMTLLTAFKVLLYRYSGQDHIAVGTPIAGRTRAEFENLIGFFVNTLVMSTDVSGEPFFRELMKRVKQTALGAYAHQDVPFEKLVEELQPPRSMSYAPLFQVMFTLQKASSEAFHMPGLIISSVATPSGTAKFDLTLGVSESEEGFTASMEYNTDLFDAMTVRRMLKHFENLLEAIAEDPDQPITALPMLSDQEQQQILVEWNQTQTNYPRQLTIQELFQQQVEQRPEAIALEYGQQRISYGELNRRANQLGHYLQGIGIGPEVGVGVCMERSIDMIVGLLGILKAGGAYVPLDPSYPGERLAFLFKDSQTPLLLTQQKLLSALSMHCAHVVCLDTDWVKIERESEENPALCTVAENLAYVMYTSGSTGTPKGVSVSHRSVARLVKNTNYATLSPEEVFLQFAPVSFDASTLEIWGGLLNGGRVVVPPPETLSLSELGQAIEKNGITTLWLTAGLFHEMVEYQLDNLRSVRQLLAGGDILSVDHVDRVLQELKGIRLINGYGPTENTTFTCCYPLSDQKQMGASVPIGRPIANTQVYLLDSYMQPVPVGVRGELYISGDGLARGYLNRPELTAERFIPDSFIGQLGARLYKTGDLARYKSDGSIEFLGRLDDQVKIRGFRIEPGEIETVLTHHPAVREAVIVAREDTPGDKRLAAYVIPVDGSSPTMNELSSFLKDKLPEYMIPSSFVLLKAMPRTPHGKVDRHSLPPPEQGLAQRESFVPPRDILELEMARIWEDVLGIKPIGVKDDFFKLGGHSLLVFRLRAQIEKAFGQNLPLAVLFQGPNIEHLTSRLRKKAEPHSRSPLVKIQPGESSRPFFCAHPGGGSVLCYLALARHLGSDQAFYAFQSPGVEEEQSLLTDIDEMAAEYVEAMRAVQPAGPYFLGGWSMGGVVAYEMAQQLQAKGEEVALLVLMDARAPNPFEDAIEDDGLSLIINFGWNLGITSDFETLGWESLERLPLDEQLSAVMEQARNASLLPPDIAPSQFCHLFEVFKSNVAAMCRYKPQPTKVPITLLKASELFEQSLRDPAMGWNKLAGGGLTIHEVPGNHFTMVYEPHVQTLAEILKTCLHEASASKR